MRSALAIAATAATLTLAVSNAQGDPPVTGAPSTTEPATVWPDPAVSVLRVKLAAEHRRYVAATRRVRQLSRVLLSRSSTHEAIELACSVYGNCATLWRRALCESHANPYAVNPAGPRGLFQFLPSTFASTPFGRFSIWSPYANALAAGWMETHGRGGEWACR